MMNEMNMPLTYWAEAVHTTVHIMNRTPTAAIREISPYERLYGIKPTVSYMKVFGCVCYVHVPNEARKKMEPKAVKCIFLGYPVEKTGYKCYDPTTRQVYVSRDVRFCEHEPWYKPKPVTIEDEYEEQENVRHVVDESGTSTRTISGPHMTEESTGSVNPWSGRLRNKKQDERGKKKMFEESSRDESFDEEHGLPHLRTPGSKYAGKYVPPYARVEEKSAPWLRRSKRRLTASPLQLIPARLAMEEREDLYAIVGLKPGLQGGSEASFEAIRKAYRATALLCHPDKRPDDPLAAVEFQRLQKAYDVLSDEKARKAYDDLLSVRKARLEKESRADSKRRKMLDDLEKRENLARTQSKEKGEEERAVKRFQDEVARIRATRGWRSAFSQAENLEKSDGQQEKEKILKVSWKPAKSGGSDYSAVMLRDYFSQFGNVEDVVIRHKKGALVVMSSREEVITASRQPHGSLFAVPLVPQTGSNIANTFVSSSRESEEMPSSLGGLVGNAFHDHEDSILEKLRKVHPT
ncbi:hypothetical protein L7F22_014648 [Adiantum nelumboides]|nr:hypothetical protein [Adiantum nelumboides]